jgi:hypothetical protein
MRLVGGSGKKKRKEKKKEKIRKNTYRQKTATSDLRHAIFPPLGRDYQSLLLAWRSTWRASLFFPSRRLRRFPKEIFPSGTVIDFLVTEGHRLHSHTLIHCTSDAYVKVVHLVQYMQRLSHKLVFDATD